MKSVKNYYTQKLCKRKRKEKINKKERKKKKNKNVCEQK